MYYRLLTQTHCDKEMINSLEGITDINNALKIELSFIEWCIDHISKKLTLDDLYYRYKKKNLIEQWFCNKFSLGPLFFIWNK